MQRRRVCESIVHVKGTTAGLSACITRQVYSLHGPLYLWHIDGHHKLVRWCFVIHGGVHGFRRVIVFMNISDSN